MKIRLGRHTCVPRMAVQRQVCPTPACRRGRAPVQQWHDTGTCAGAVRTRFGRRRSRALFSPLGPVSARAHIAGQALRPAVRSAPPGPLRVHQPVWTTRDNALMGSATVSRRSTVCTAARPDAVVSAVAVVERTAQTTATRAPSPPSQPARTWAAKEQHLNSIFQGFPHLARPVLCEPSACVELCDLLIRLVEAENENQVSTVCERI